MNTGNDSLKEDLRRRLLEAGACAVGFAVAGTPDAGVGAQMRDWTGGGNHAGMEYLERHIPLKMHPRNVLADAATVVSAAWSYAPPVVRDPSLPSVSTYAYGKDYHDVVRRRMERVVVEMAALYGGSWRVCVDTAPLPERYWAVKTGIGERCLNGSVAVEGFGSMVFLSELLTSHPVAPDRPSRGFCNRCGKCREACPTGALQADGTVDCRRCISYLTIEHRGEWTAEGLAAMQTEAGKHTLYGCDRCVAVCPLNRGTAPTAIGEFRLDGGFAELDAAKVASMTQEDFSRIFKGSAIKRAKLDGLRRNALNLLLWGAMRPKYR